MYRPQCTVTGAVQGRADPAPGVLEDPGGSVEPATLEWASWFNSHRLMALLGYAPSIEFEANYYRNLEQQAMLA